VPEPDPQPLPPYETLAVAQELLDDGRAFRAHEVFEARWKAVTGAERELWRGLAQVAVAVTHAQRGNDRGRVSLLERAAATLAPWQDSRPYDVDIAAVRAWALSGAAESSSRADDLLARLPRLSSGRR
jgi:predicted metal-dependent hydrolase